MRLGLRTTAVAVGACALLSGCFGSGSSTPTAAHTHHRSHGSTPSTGAASTPTSPASSEPTTPPTTGAGGAATTLRFFPKSNGRHSHQCLTISGSQPVDYLYYPVVFESSAPVKLTTAAVTYADGVQVAGAWVAPSAPTQGTGLDGWPPPSTVTRSSAVQWSRRVPAAGASLTPGTWYNVFLHLRVYPDALPLATTGVVLTFTDSSGTHTVTWGYHLAFKSAC